MAAPFQALPEGVYFNPSAEECVRDFLRPWIAGVRPATDRVIVDVNIYSDSPAALVRGREPGFSRNFEHKWFMLTQCVRMCGGKNRGKARAKRDVATGGNWKVEQRAKGVAERAEDDDDPPGGDRRRTNGFYLPLVGVGKGAKKDGGVKTPWLMEELTTAEDEAAAVDGWKGPRTIQVFCKLYISPRATNDEKRDILGEDGVSVDLQGHPKTATAELPEEFFVALAENLNRHRGPATPPPLPPAPEQAVGHQQGQPAAPVLPRVPGHHHGHTVLPRGVPALPHQIQGNLGFQRAQAAPGQTQIQAGGPSQHHGVAVHPHRQHVLDPYHHFQFQEAALYHYSAPSFVRLDPRQGEQMIHVEKKPRLAYVSPSPAPQPQGRADSDMSSCVVQASLSQEQGQGSDTDAEGKVFQGEPVLTPSPSPPQEIPGTADAAPPAPTHDVSTAVPLELGSDVCEPRSERDMFMDLPVLTPEPFVGDVPDFLMQDVDKPPFDDEPQPPLGFDVFTFDDLFKDSPDFCP